MRKNNKYLVLSAFVGLCLLFVPVMAHADFSLSFGDNGYYPDSNQHTDISKVEVFVYDSPGVAFTGAGATNLTSSSTKNLGTWTATLVNPTYVLMEGKKALQDLYWTLLFSGDAPSEFRLDYLVYGKKNKVAFGISLAIVDGQVNITQGSGWVALDPTNLPNYNRNPVPLPPSVWLLGVGLVGAFIFRKKMAS